MYIFIDESGNFKLNRQENPIDIIGALVIPHYAYNSIIQECKLICEKWKITSEIKGKDLNEEQVDELVKMLEAFDVLFVCTMVDTKTQTPAAITKHKYNQKNNIQSNITEFHHPNTISQIIKFSNLIDDIPDQLYIQYNMMSSLIINVHQLSTLYYVQRMPKELGSFQWRIDTKDKKITKVEAWWHDILRFIIQGYSLKTPMIMLTDTDYSFYEQFTDKITNNGNINKILRDLIFVDSSKQVGIQLVDVLTSALRRAMNNKFKEHGWYKIGRLMTYFNQAFIPLLGFEDKAPYMIKTSYAHVVNTLKSNSKALFLS